MKRIMISLLVGIITVCSGIGQRFEAFDKIPKCVDTALYLVESIEKTQVDYTSYMYLYGLSGEKEYVYIELEKGYIIASANNGALSEFDLSNNVLPYGHTDAKYNLYGGPFNYFTFNEKAEMMSFVSQVDKTLLAKNQEFCNNTNGYSDEEMKRFSKATWAGIPSWKMSSYSSGMWINDLAHYPTSLGYPSAGICGTIASAGLLAYYQDYVNSNYVPSSMRSQYSNSPGTLISTLFTYIDQLHPGGTVGSHLLVGGNNFLQTYSYVSSGHQFAASVVSVWTGSINKINSGYPLVVGLLAALGSTYGNHWVLAYRYYDDTGSANDLLMVVDNHGSYVATVNRAWLSERVFIDN
ncbi:MAG: hypothetical protein IJG59_06375 [Erysipelotrichaceae bacterium]|nr:hypothetical protein [Erysipelotrichaceae bacterium]